MPIDLEYAADSLLNPCETQRFQDLEAYLSNYYERDIVLPESYTGHVGRFHGGVPGKGCFDTAKGTRSIGRMFNLLKSEDSLTPFIPSWRDSSDDPTDIRLDYSVYEYFENERWNGRLREVEDALVPIAGLDHGGLNCRGMYEFDLLCLNFHGSGEPTVVVFNFERAEISTVVAPSFADFLSMLYRCSYALPDEEDDF